LYSKVQKPEINVFLPSEKNATGEAVVICPGGGYQVLAWDWEGLDIAKWLNAHGIAAVILKYRLPLSKSNIVRDKSPLLDAQRAVRYTRYHASEWHIDPSKIGIMGFSAGGHLASTAGTHYDAGNPRAKDPVDRMSSRPDFMILMYPVITFEKDVMHRGSRDALLGENPGEELIRFYSGELNVTPDTPPTFLVHAADDQAVPVENSLLFFEALKKNEVSVEMHIFPEGGHGFSLGIGMGHLATWPDMCIRWINWLELKKKN
jgi:acetyl esterase/lipase